MLCRLQRERNRRTWKIGCAATRHNTFASSHDRSSQCDTHEFPKSRGASTARELRKVYDVSVASVTGRRQVGVPCRAVAITWSYGAAESFDFAKFAVSNGNTASLGGGGLGLRCKGCRAGTQFPTQADITAILEGVLKARKAYRVGLQGTAVVSSPPSDLRLCTLYAGTFVSVEECMR